MVTKDEARQYLCDVAPEKCFWTSDGQVYKNLEEFANGLQNMSSETFKYHANNEKNDFSTWVKEVIGDVKLANDLLSSRSKNSAAKKIMARVTTLKKKAA